MVDYLEFLGKYSLSYYEESRDTFRAVTHTVYKYTATSQKEDTIFKEMLATTRELAGHRQSVTALLKRRISSYGWSVVGSVEIMVVVSILLTQGPGILSLIVHVAAISSIFIVTLLLWEVDTQSASRLREYGDRYGETVGVI